VIEKDNVDFIRMIFDRNGKKDNILLDTYLKIKPYVSIVSVCTCTGLGYFFRVYDKFLDDLRKYEDYLGDSEDVLISTLYVVHEKLTMAVLTNGVRHRTVNTGNNGVYYSNRKLDCEKSTSKIVNLLLQNFACKVNVEKRWMLSSIEKSLDIMFKQDGNSGVDIGNYGDILFRIHGYPVDESYVKYKDECVKLVNRKLDDYGYAVSYGKYKYN
jgi:hypothetical protein